VSSFIYDFITFIRFIFHIPTGLKEAFSIESVAFSSTLPALNWLSLIISVVIGAVSKKIKDRKANAEDKNFDKNNTLATLCPYVKRIVFALFVVFFFYVSASFFAISIGGYNSLTDYLLYLLDIPSAPLFPTLSKATTSDEFFLSFSAIMVMVISSNISPSVVNIFKNEDIQTSFFSFIRALWLAIPLAIAVSFFWPSAFTTTGIVLSFISYFSNLRANEYNDLKTIISNIKQEIKDLRNNNDNQDITITKLEKKEALLQNFFSMDRIKAFLLTTKNVANLNHDKPSAKINKLSKLWYSFRLLCSKVFTIPLFLCSFLIVCYQIKKTGLATLFPLGFWRFTFFAPTLTLFDFTFFDYFLHSFIFAFLPSLVLFIVDCVKYCQKKKKAGDIKLKGKENSYLRSYISEISLFRLFFYTTLGTMFMMLFTIYLSAVLSALVTAIMLGILTKIDKYGLSIQYEEGVYQELKTLTYEEEITKLSNLNQFSIDSTSHDKTNLLADVRRKEAKARAKATRKVARITTKTKRSTKKMARKIKNTFNIAKKEQLEKKLIEIIYRNKEDIADIKLNAQKEIANIKYEPQKEIAKKDAISKHAYNTKLALNNLVIDARSARLAATQSQLDSTDLIQLHYNQAADFIKKAKQEQDSTSPVIDLATLNKIACEKAAFLDKAKQERDEAVSSAKREKAASLQRIEQEKIVARKRVNLEKDKKIKKIDDEAKKEIDKKNNEIAAYANRINKDEDDINKRVAKERSLAGLPTGSKIYDVQRRLPRMKEQMHQKPVNTGSTGGVAPKATTKAESNKCRVLAKAEKGKHKTLNKTKNETSVLSTVARHNIRGTSPAQVNQLANQGIPVSYAYTTTRPTQVTQQYTSVPSTDASQIVYRGRFGRY